MENAKHQKSRLNKFGNLPIGDRIYLSIVYLFLGIFLLMVIYPLLYVVSCSFSSPEALIQGRVFFFPVEPGIQGYEAVFSNTRIWRGYLNTIVYTVLGTGIGTCATISSHFLPFFTIVGLSLRRSPQCRRI